MFEHLKELFCDMAKQLTHIAAGFTLFVLQIRKNRANQKQKSYFVSYFVRYARRFGFRADHTKHEPRAEIGGRGSIQGARPAIRAD